MDIFVVICYFTLWCITGCYAAALDVSMSDGCVFSSKNLTWKRILGYLMCGPGHWITAAILECGGIIAKFYYQKKKDSKIFKEFKQ